MNVLSKLNGMFTICDNLEIRKQMLYKIEARKIEILDSLDKNDFDTEYPHLIVFDGKVCGYQQFEVKGSETGVSNEKFMALLGTSQAYTIYGGIYDWKINTGV